MANSPGPYVQQATAAIASNEFHGIKLASNTKVDIQVHPGQFFRSLVANLRQRLFTTTASHVGMSDKLRTAAAASYSTLLSAMEVFDKDNWPKKDGNDDARFGEVEIGVLCSKMGLETRPAILAFREYRDAQSQQTLQNRPVPSHLQVLEHAVETYVVSTAECERSFSVMNDTLTPIRNNLSVKHLSALVFIKCVGPPLSKFQPKNYVASWIKKGRRSATKQIAQLTRIKMHRTCRRRPIMNCGNFSDFGNCKLHDTI
jgi:hypothetical protein